MKTLNLKKVFLGQAGALCLLSSLVLFLSPGKALAEEGKADSTQQCAELLEFVKLQKKILQKEIRAYKKHRSEEWWIQNFSKHIRVQEQALQKALASLWSAILYNGAQVSAGPYEIKNNAPLWNRGLKGGLTGAMLVGVPLMAVAGYMMGLWESEAATLLTGVGSVVAGMLYAAFTPDEIGENHQRFKLTGFDTDAQGYKIVSQCWLYVEHNPVRSYSSQRADFIVDMNFEIRGCKFRYADPASVSAGTMRHDVPEAKLPKWTSLNSQKRQQLEENFRFAGLRGPSVARGTISIRQMPGKKVHIVYNWHDHLHPDGTSLAVELKKEDTNEGGLQWTPVIYNGHRWQKMLKKRSFQMKKWMTKSSQRFRWGFFGIFFR